MGPSADGGEGFSKLTGIEPDKQLDQRVALESLFQLAVELSDDEFRAVFPVEVAASSERLRVDLADDSAVAFVRLQAAAVDIRSWAQRTIDGYGGVWIAGTAPPVLYIGSVYAAHGPQVDARLAEFADLGFAVEIRQVRYSAEQLFSLAQDLSAAARATLDDAAGVAFVVNYETNSLEYHGQSSALQVILDQVPDDIATVISAEYEALVPPATVPGGWDGRSANGCTMAFNVITPASGHGVLTAGHCSATGPTYGSVVLGNQTFRRSWWVGGNADRPYDRQIHPIPSPHVGNGRLVVPGNTTVHGLVVPVQGVTVCRYGATTHQEEGLHTRCTVVDGFDADGLVRLRYSCAGGDSGGPSWYFNRAVGIAAATTHHDAPGVPSGFCFMANAKDALNGTDYFYKQYEYGAGADHQAIGLYRSIAPVRVLNGSTHSGTFTVNFTSSLPYEDVEAVVYSIKARASSTAGHIQAYPAGTLIPDSSILNYTTAWPGSNTSITPVRRSDRAVTFRASSAAQVWIDVIGYIADTSGDEALSTHRRVRALYAPTRVLNTTSGSPIGAGAYVQFAVRGGGTSVPTSATHVLVNLTVTQPTADGYATVYPSGTVPAVSHLNWLAGQTRANLVITPIASNGTIRVFNAHGQSHFVADILGYTEAQSASTSLGRTLPALGGAARLYDSRTQTPLSSGSPVRCIGLYELRDETGAGLPMDGLSGVWLNMTAVNPTAAGWLRVYPDGASAVHSNLNFGASDMPVANLAFVWVPPDGDICVRYGGSGSVHYLLDVIAFTREST